MYKYKIYRSFGSIDKSIRKHELIGVVSAADIEEAEDQIIEEVKADLAGNTDVKFKKFTVDAEDLEPAEDHHKSKRYDYCILGIIYPDMAEKNILIEYGIIEEKILDDLIY